MYANTVQDLPPQADGIHRHIRQLLLQLVARKRARVLSRGKTSSSKVAIPEIAVNPLYFRDIGYRETLKALPAPVSVPDAMRFITFNNEAAVTLWGRRLILGQDRWCGSWRILHTDGTLVPHEDCPMAIALRENRLVRNIDAIAEHPDGTRVHFMPFPTPLHDAGDDLIGAVNVLIDLGTLRNSAQARAGLREAS